MQTNSGYCVITATDRDGVTTTIERDANGIPTAIEGHYGQRTTLSPNLDGYIGAVTNELSEQTLFEYDTAVNPAAGREGYLSKMTDALNREHLYSYAGGRLQRDTDPVGGYQDLQFTKTTDGHEVLRSTALGRETNYSVYQDDESDAHRDITSPAGFTTLSENKRSADSNVTYPDGTTRYVDAEPDDRFGLSAPFVRGTTTTLPSGLTRTTSRTQSVTLASSIDPLSVTSWTETSSVNGQAAASVSYSSSTRTYSSSSPEGRTSTTTLDSLGRVSQVSVPGIAPVTYTYDADGRVQSITQTSATDGTRTTTYAYDTDGFLQSVTAPSLRQTSYTYDAVGRPLVTTLPDTETLSTSWDAMDNLKSITPPGKSAHLFSYTDRDEVEAYEPPDAPGATNATSNAYDLDRDLELQTLMSGRTVDPLMDSAGRLDSVTIDRGVIDFAYRASDGKLESITSPEGNTLTMGYDGPLTTSVTWAGAVNAQVAFGYDNHFRVTSVTVDAEPAVSYAYDQDNFITNAAGMSISRDAQNALLTGTSITDSGSGNSVASTRSHNDFGEVQTLSTTYAGGDLAYSFAYDIDGRIESRAETSGASSTTQAYEYDLRGRLTDVYVDSVLTYEYDYDENGNRVAYTGPEGAVSATYDAQDRLLTYGTNSYTYNADGQLLTKTSGSDVTSYEYDELGGLNRVTLPDSTVIDYVLDGAGRRIAKKVNGTFVRQWVYQDGLNPVSEYDGAGNLIQQFVYATRINVPDLIIRGGTTYRVIADQVGSVRQVVEVSTGGIVQEMTYSPFGKVLSDSSAGWQPFGFAGGHYDGDTGLVRFGARDYDAEVGRWTSKDPIGFDGGDANLFLYVGAYPVGASDPSGLLKVGGQSAGLANLRYDILTVRENLSDDDIRVAARILHVPISEVEQALQPGQGPTVIISAIDTQCAQVKDECSTTMSVAKRTCSIASTETSSWFLIRNDVASDLNGYPNGRATATLLMHELMHALYKRHHGDYKKEPFELGYEWEIRTGRAGRKSGCMCD